MLEPKAGLVIRYDFLWKHEEERGQEQGVKDRPCAIILASKEREDGRKSVVLCPVTHTPPDKEYTAVEIPPKVSIYLGLVDGRSWIKTDQINSVEWNKGQIPYEITPASKGSWAFGELPHQLGKQVFDQVGKNIRNKKLSNIKRG